MNNKKEIMNLLKRNSKEIDKKCEGCQYNKCLCATTLDCGFEDFILIDED